MEAQRKAVRESGSQVKSKLTPPGMSRISPGKCRKWKEGVPGQKECTCKGPVVNRPLDPHDTPIAHQVSSCCVRELCSHSQSPEARKTSWLLNTQLQGSTAPTYSSRGSQLPPHFVPGTTKFVVLTATHQWPPTRCWALS